MPLEQLEHLERFGTAALFRERLIDKRLECSGNR